MPEKITVEVLCHVTDPARSRDLPSRIMDYTKIGGQQLMSRLYMDTASLSWNGNGVDKKDNIQKFFTDLPPSEHSIVTLDAQPIIGPEIMTELTFLVKVSGQVKHEENSSKPFIQTFMITVVGDKWKIVSDCFRVIEM